MALVMSFFFFFKQKTAYEMRISDWSSDVCSSDLGGTAVRHPRDARIDALDCVYQHGVRIDMRIGAVKPVDVGQQHNRVSPCRLSDTRRQPAIVAEADFRRGDAVILRSEERRLGKEGVRRFGSWGAATYVKKKTT